MFQINWKLKSILYRIFSYLKLNLLFYLIQKHITKTSRINLEKVNDIWKFHVNVIKKHNLQALLEIGAGKSLEQNIYLAYLFNNEVKQTVIDVTKMVDLNLFNEANKQISKILSTKKKEEVKTIKDLENFYNIRYLAPFKLDQFLESNEKFDICISTNTLEHIPEKDLNNIFFTLKKIISENKFVSSIIDYSDHYSHTDKNISKLNFLKYSDHSWQKYNNPYLYQNRLRHQDYEKIFIDNKFKITKVFKGDMLKKTGEINNKFDKDNEDTYLSWAHYLIENQK